MAISSILTQRLINQQIATCAFTKPEEIVGYLCAMQAQDYGMAKWAVGMRVPGLHDGDVENAFNEGKILRTHVLRPTWHFVSPADIRWMLELTAPRINALSAYYFRATELDAKVFKKTNAIIAKALRGNNYLTRTALQQELAKAKVKAEGLRLNYIMMRAELDAIICSGPRHGKQFTYALMDERAPQSKSLHKHEALATLAKTYFATRGPATISDFATWGGLSMTDVKQGIHLAGKSIVQQTINGKEYFYGEDTPGTDAKLSAKHQSTFLMPDYDEYGISYKDRGDIFGERKTNTNTKAENPVFYHTLIVDGTAAGTWKKVSNRKETDVEITLAAKLSTVKQQAIAKAVKKYLAFVNNKPK